MIIRWIDDARLIPTVGRIEPGQTRDLPDDMALNFIQQGQAEQVKQTTKKTVKTED